MLIGAFFLISFETANNFLNVKRECDVAQLYEAKVAERDSRVLTSDGELEKPELILLPTRMDEGTYKVEITRKGSNIYKIEGTKFYIETRYCFEYITYKSVMLKVISNYGFSKGTLYFE